MLSGIGYAYRMPLAQSDGVSSHSHLLHRQQRQQRPHFPEIEGCSKKTRLFQSQSSGVLQEGGVTGCIVGLDFLGLCDSFMEASSPTDCFTFQVCQQCADVHTEHPIILAALVAQQKRYDCQVAICMASLCSLFSHQEVSVFPASFKVASLEVTIGPLGG